MANNGELTKKKALTTIEKFYATAPDLKEICEAIIYIESLMSDTIETIEWMLKHLKWKHRLQLGMEFEADFPDSEVPWSPEMIKAMKILEKLKAEQDE